MSLSFAEEDLAPQEPSAHVPPRAAAALGVAAAVTVMLLCLASFVIGGAESGSRTGSGVGEFASNFSLRDFNENRVTLSQYRGRPVLLLISQDPLSREVLQQATGLSGELVVINVHEVEAASQARARASMGTDRPVVHLLDQHGVVSQDYDLTQLPAALVISPDGLILDAGPLSQTLARLSDD